ncbi:MAG TPA: hypothetical protein VGP25_12760 [Gemmatimonadaceae bacterium]|nr:hypothetical protein [Gemmatimonadaceae bacterium]
MAQPLPRDTTEPPTPPARPRRRVARAIVGAVVVPILLGLVIVLVLAMTPWGNERVRRVLVSQANDRMNGSLSVATLRGNLLSGATLTGVRLLDSARHPLFTAQRVRVGYDLLAALGRRVVLRSVELDTAVVLLDKQPGARWNFQSLMRPSTTPKDTSRHGAPPEIANITIRHGRMIYRRPWSPDTSLTRDGRDSAIAAALGGSARSRTERVPGGFQRVLDYHDIDARLPSVRMARQGQPMAVEIGALSMLAEPYRPPAIDVRSLVGTLYASKDSLWWRGARMALPGSTVSGDGTIGFHRSGFRLDLTGAPVSFADLRWLNPKLPASGGGTLRYTMRIRGDTTALALADANVRYRDATIAGRAAIAQIGAKGKPKRLVIDGADLTVSRLSTAIIHELAPSLGLHRTGVLDGHVVVSGAPSAQQLDADVTFDDRAAGRSHIVARGGFGLEHGVQARDLVVRLQPLQVATLSAAGMRLPVGGTLSGDATVNGAMADGWRVRGDLTHVDDGARSRVSGSGSYATGTKHITADAALAPLSLATVGRFAPAAGLRGAVAGRVHAEGSARDLTLHGTLRSTSGGGALDARGSVALRGSRTRYDVTATTDALDASAFSRRGPSTSLTGTIVARGTGFSPASAHAVVSADLAHSRYDSLLVDRLRARLSVGDGLLHVDTLGMLAQSARVGAEGTLGLVAARSGALRFSAAVDSLGAFRRWLGTSDTSLVSAAATRQRAVLLAARADSARRADALRIEQLALGLPVGVAIAYDTLPPVRRDSLAGRLRASGTLSGSVKTLGVEATLDGAGMVARGSSVRRLSATVSGSDVTHAARVMSVRASADSIETSGRTFDRIDASGRWSDGTIAADLRVRQDSLVRYAALGSYRQWADGARLVTLDSLSATFDTLGWRLARRGSVRVDHGSVVIDSILMRSSAGGRLFASGVVPESGPIALDVAAEGVLVSTVMRALQRDTDVSGAISTHARIEGTRALPVLDGRAELTGASYGATHLPDVSVGVRYRDRLLLADGQARDSVRVVGTVVASLPLNLAFASVAGARRLDGPLSVSAVLDSLSLAALPFPSRSFEDVRGIVVGRVNVGGTWRAPTYLGSGALRNGAITLASTGMRVSDAVADLSLAGDTLRLDSLVARARGPLRASGTVDLRDRANPFVRFAASGEDLRVMDQRRGELDVDADVRAEGPLSELRVSGGGELKGGYLALKQFRKDLLRVKPPGELSSFAVLDTSAVPNDSARIAAERRIPRRLAMVGDLSLVIDRGNYYRNRPDANTEFSTGDGEVVVAHIDQRSADQWVIGFVRIPGGVAYFRTQPFIPARGSLTFGPHTNAVGIVQQVGERLLWEPGRGWFPLQFITAGTSKAPAIALESGTLFPIRGRELNGYLTQGHASTSLFQQSGSSLSGSESWSGQLSGESGALARRQQGATALGVVLHDIGTGTTKEYGLDAFSVSPADVPTELVFGKTGGVRGALVEGGRYLTTDRYVAGQLRLTAGIPGFRLAQRFGTTYRLDIGLEPRYLFRSPEELGITHPTVRTGVFGAFLTRLWDF